ncbi:uncharacterized protein NECHADRAFT_51984 [Fusarium vanettenii 77-13-4]|uniref:EthD domain-containing protein n=1 Tax=Fusarium vanettenii (strain ATCC MYA-4622 / CBS 123669 / FGSC 9596 / NRRL 45880 / 77-13-4) TaxID=660122 RepID=C7ZHC2_FUSV7|nr:uncharacterized protein NECHADRAFT_51984 [Fusarium vanettenii 77-13-4]EEU36657.1 hypothetical protein NECHADRAFT_51984 [Fusarium vanettenii 77-13-4]
MAQVLVVYPSGPSFDHDYYIKSHMPLVAASWGSAGLLSWEILNFTADAPYQVQATLKWKSIADFEAAAASPAAEKVFGDIKNFTSAEPILLKGDVVASQTLA